MSTSLSIDRLRASGLAALITSKYPRVPFEAIPALPEVQGITRRNLDTAIDIAVAEGWIVQNAHGEVVAPALRDLGSAA